MAYEIVKVLGSENKPHIMRESSLVKIDPTLCRESNTLDLYEVSHVIVESMRLFDSGRTYEETHVVASDETGKAYPAVLYQATRALTISEAMFSIGQHNFIEHPENDHIALDKGEEEDVD